MPREEAWLSGRVGGWVMGSPGSRPGYSLALWGGRTGTNWLLFIQVNWYPRHLLCKLCMLLFTLHTHFICIIQAEEHSYACFYVHHPSWSTKTFPGSACVPVLLLFSHVKHHLSLISSASVVTNVYYAQFLQCSLWIKLFRLGTYSKLLPCRFIYLISWFKISVLVGFSVGKWILVSMLSISTVNIISDITRSITYRVPKIRYDIADIWNHVWYFENEIYSVSQLH